MAIGRIVRSLAATLAVVVAGAVPGAQAQDWDGSGLVRFGVFLQAQSVDFDVLQRPGAAAPFRQHGFGVGIAAGYDLRLGSFVVGAEIDGSFDDGGAKLKPIPAGARNEQLGVDYFATLRGRLGYIVHPNFLLYVTGGYGLLGAEFKDNALGGAGSNKKFMTLDGITFGGGVEWDMGWGISFFEYLHTDFTHSTFRALTLNGNLVDLNANSDVFRLGLKFKVGHDYTHDVYRRPEPLK
jgi:opacity protein-like surface antigen